MNVLTFAVQALLKRWFVPLIAVQILAASCFAQNAALPRVLLNPVPPIVTGTSRTVCASGCLYTTPQTAWNAATCGDELVLTAGQTFAPLTLSNKACVGSILIRSSNSGMLASGTRTGGSANAANFATILITANNTYGIQNDYTNATISARAAHDVYMLGLNLVLSPTVTQNYGLLALTTGLGGDPAGAPTNITFDRGWIHTDHLATSAAGEDFVRGFTGGGSGIAIINSTVEGFSSPTSGLDSQAIGIFDGPGPGLIRNVEAVAATENIMPGGSTNSQTNQVADWEFSFNYVHKTSGLNVPGTNEKNCLEIKTGVRLWYHDNLIENCFSNSGQIGDAILITNRPFQSGYGNTVSDVTFQGNVARHVGHVTNVGGNDNACGVMNSTVNTVGTAFTITAGTQGNSIWVQSIPLPVTVNGVANTITAFSDATHGTLSASAGTQTGVAMVTIYNNCSSQTRVTLQNNLFEDIDRTYNGGQSVAYAYFLSSPFTLFDHNTMIPGTVSPSLAGMYGGSPYTSCTTPIAGYATNLSITNNIESVANNGIFADCFNGPSPWLASPAGVNIALTNNLAQGANAPEQPAWNVIGSANQFPANYAAIGLLSDNKALSPLSTYFSTGAGANLETCFAETAIRAGTPASSSCVTGSGTGTTISGSVSISGSAKIQ